MSRTAIYFEHTQVKNVGELIIFDVIPTEEGDRVIAGIDTRYDREKGVYVLVLSVCSFTDVNTRTRIELPYEGGIAVLGRFVDPMTPDHAGLSR